MMTGGPLRCFAARAAAGQGVSVCVCVRPPGDGCPLKVPGFRIVQAAQWESVGGSGLSPVQCVAPDLMSARLASIVCVYVHPVCGLCLSPTITGDACRPVGKGTMVDFTFCTKADFIRIGGCKETACGNLECPGFQHTAQALCPSFAVQYNQAA